MRKASIVIGANYGDEGKGTVVASLTRDSKNVLNILTNGGAQRGHSILTKDGSMTFQHFGSGTYHGADTYYSRYYILNPMQFAQEYAGLFVKPKHIYRDRRCRWTTPYDMMANLITEEKLKRKASCGMGIWNTIRRCNRTIDTLFDEFMSKSDDWKQRLHLQAIKAYYEREMDIPESWREVWNSDGVIDHFLRDCTFLLTHTEVLDWPFLQCDEYHYDHFIFENGQGLMLKDTGKDTADTTPSDTGITYGLLLAKQLHIGDVTAHYVTRPYLTRHGDGHIMHGKQRESLSADIAEDRTNHYNDRQGEFRYGHLDILALHDRIYKDACGVNIEIHVTHCDEMDRTQEFRRQFGQVNCIDGPVV